MLFKHRIDEQQRDNFLKKFIAESQGDVAPPPEASRSGKGARLLADVGCAINLPLLTGIPRVVSSIMRTQAMRDAVPVFFKNDKLVTYEPARDRLRSVEIAPGDIYFMPDSAWGYPVNIHATMHEVREAGGTNVMLLYDMFPMSLRPFCPPELSYAFEEWFHHCALKADALICISRAVADELVAFLDSQGIGATARPHIGWAHLGADICENAGGDVSDKVRRLVESTGPYFLSVSTIEPRKGYAVALDAFDGLSARDETFKYCIVGGGGWYQDEVKARILNHPLLNKRLFWFQGVSDAELSLLYRNARALISASIAEGFGLPLIEASYYGLPVIVSDIPVYRELCGDHAAYFAVADAGSLAQRLVEALASPKTPSAIPHQSWEAAAANMRSMIARSAYQYPRPGRDAAEASR